MKVRFYCNNSANIHSSREEVVDLVDDWNYTKEECEAMNGKDLALMAEEWASEFLEVSCTKIEE